MEVIKCEGGMRGLRGSWQQCWWPPQPSSSSGASWEQKQCLEQELGTLISQAEMLQCVEKSSAAGQDMAIHCFSWQRDG